MDHYLEIDDGLTMERLLAERAVNSCNLTTTMENLQLVKINVGGRIFMTSWNTLSRLPGTTLSEVAQLKTRHPNYSAKEDWYFFDRNPDCFACLLEYYRTDEFHLNENICGLSVTRELDFWGLNEAEIEPCCWGKYAKFQSHKETLQELETAFEDDDPTIDLDSPESQELTGWKRTQRIGWLHLEYPSRSVIAKVVMLCSMLFVLLSIFTTILETHYLFQVIRHSNDTVTPANPPPKPRDTCNCGPPPPKPNSTSEMDTVSSIKGPHDVLLVMDYICLGYFLLELLVRAIFAPDKLRFFKAPFTIIDIVCIIPQIISVIIQTGDYGERGTDSDRQTYDRASGFLNAITALRTVRILRVFKLMKYYSAFKILAYTIKVSLKELALLIAFFMSGVVIFASIIHYAEQETFPDIPIGLWWAVVTMTTVGYGDYAPKQIGGYLIGSMCGLCGVLVIAFTVPIVVNNFTMYYTHAKTRRKLPKESVRHARKSKMIGRQNTIATLIGDRDRTEFVHGATAVNAQSPLIPRVITTSNEKLHSSSLSSVNENGPNNNHCADHIDDH